MTTMTPATRWWTSLLAVLVMCGTTAWPQQLMAPLRAGTPEVPVPDLAIFVSPISPGSLSVTSTPLEVLADVHVGPDGRVIDVPRREYVIPERLGAAPLRLQNIVPGLSEGFVLGYHAAGAADVAIRQWTFTPTMRDGLAISVVVPVKVRFEIVRARVTSFYGQASSGEPPPTDFAVRYAYGRCALDTQNATFTMQPVRDEPVTTVGMPLTVADLDLLYREMLRVGFFDYPRRISVDYAAIPPVSQESEFVRRNTAIEVVVRSEARGPLITHPDVTHRFEVVRNGVTHLVVWNDAYTGPSITPVIEGVRSVIAAAQQIIKSKASVQALEPVFRECRGLQ